MTYPSSITHVIRQNCHKSVVPSSVRQPFHFISFHLSYLDLPGKVKNSIFIGINVTTWKWLYLSVICCCRVLFLSSFTVGVDLSKSTTCLHFHALIYSKYDIVKRFPHTYVTLNNSLGNTIIPSQRLVTTSASLRTQTGLCHLILQVLNIKSLLPKCLIQSLSLL